MQVILKTEDGHTISRGTLADFVAEQDCGFQFADGTYRETVPEAELAAMLASGPVLFGGGAFPVSVLTKDS